jgi:predicted AlkP superfamily pyrophosphatase or phosphodiesterase
MVKIYFFLIFIFFIKISYAQPAKTKLMIGIVVDQMRPDYLDRFYGQFSENGFKRLLREGFICRNTHINYAPTVTGPGHASIYSGTTPKYHGIAENDWYDRITGKMVYCAEDTLVQSVGNPVASRSSYSACNLLVTNLSDELKISTNKKGKVIAMSLKDRGATMPAGHMADGAFWFDQKTGNFISSTYYLSNLPDWVLQFNNEKHSQKYLETTWDLLLPANSYSMSIADDNPYEITLPGKSKPTFPYPLKEISGAKKIPFYSIYASAFGNSLLTDFAIEALKNAGLGTDEYPDLLAISFSSTDVVGHLFGPQSKELNDTYLRLDMDLTRLFAALDKIIGKENYTLFLTADHGAGEVPQYMADMNIPAGYIDTAILAKDISEKLTNKFGSGKWIECFISNQIYLSHSLAETRGLDISVVQDYVAEVLRRTKGIAEVFTAKQLISNEYTTGLANLVQKGFYANRSGDVIYVLQPNWNEKSEYSATHGSPYAFDTHIPLIWYGAGIPKGESYNHYNVTDIAPTVSSILHIKLPGSCIGNPIQGVLQNK